MVYGYVVVYGCPEGNRLAKWYWDCEHHENGEFGSLGSRAGRWSEDNCSDDSIFRHLELAERVI